VPNAADIHAGQPTSVDINTVVVTGYLARKPAVHPSRSGDRMVVLRLAIRRSPSKLDYIDVVASPQQADRASRLAQGQRVLVTGRLQQHRWKAKTGVARCKHAIVDSTVEQLATSGELPNPSRPSPAT